LCSMLLHAFGCVASRPLQVGSHPTPSCETRSRPMAKGSQLVRDLAVKGGWQFKGFWGVMSATKSRRSLK